jgi:hypothetical protein
VLVSYKLVTTIVLADLMVMLMQSSTLVRSVPPCQERRSL